MAEGSEGSPWGPCTMGVNPIHEDSNLHHLVTSPRPYLLITYLGLGKQHMLFGNGIQWTAESRGEELKFESPFSSLKICLFSEVS